MKVLVTGAAGFIGFHVSQALLARGDTVIGIDNLNDYYDVALKIARVKMIETNHNSRNFQFIKLDIADAHSLPALFAEHNPQRVVHLAAQAGVRYSLINPQAYVQSNMVGFANMLEACRHRRIEHLVYASSSSVYGGNTKLPFNERDNVDNPVSLYAATKKSNELMAQAYSHLYAIPSTGLRFFTVYGPWGRPDMSPILFADAITQGKSIQVFNHGNMLRDFTYIDDIVEGVVRVLDKVATPETNNHAPHRLFNIGNNSPEKLMDFIEMLEHAFGKTAQKEYLPMQSGDVKATYADTSALDAWIGFKPHTPLIQGVEKFVAWYKSYY
ncbi:MAG: NAD-dependent epimerase [Methylophilaceae bacterium]